MRRIIILMLMFAVLISPLPVTALNQDIITHSSYAKTADGVGYASPCYLVKVKGKTDGTNNLVLKVYDNSSAATGNVVAEFTILGPDIKGGEIFDNLVMANGIFVDMTTAGTGTWWVEYKKP